VFSFLSKEIVCQFVSSRVGKQKNPNVLRYIAQDFLQYLCEGKTFYENKNSPKYVH